MPRAFITGVSGKDLTCDERRFVADERPAGLILFARNIETADQVRSLIAEFKEACGASPVLVMVDQEGGRVQRLRPPIASRLPAAARYSAGYLEDPEQAVDAAWGVARLAAEELRELGFNADCAPVLDLPVPGSHGVIGDRAFAARPGPVVALGRAFARGLMAGGVLPIMKHIPGHGRACVDSHHELPVVDATLDTLRTNDFVPFRALRELPAAMTAHVVYSAIDPDSPASTSRLVTADVIRGDCGFDGLLMSDDLCMKALDGTFRERTRAVLEAGSDLALHCSGILDEMREVAAAAPAMSGPSARRLEAALAITAALPSAFDAEAARARLGMLDGPTV
jgi:beta-N-acetylhexosaminidase